MVKVTKATMVLTMTVMAADTAAATEGKDSTTNKSPLEIMVQYALFLLCDSLLLVF